MARGLIIAGKILLFLGAAFVLIGYAGTWYFDGYETFLEILSPYNLKNLLGIIITLLPGFVLLKWGKWLEKRNRANEAEPDQAD